MDDSTLTGLEKASVLILALDPEKSTAVLDQLTEEERVVIGAQILRLRRVDDSMRDRVLTESGRAIGALASAAAPGPEEPPRSQCFGFLRDVFGSALGSSPVSLFARRQRIDRVEAITVESPEDMLKLPTEALRAVLSGCDALDIALTIIFAGDELKTHVLSSLPTRVLGFVQDYLASFSGVRVGEIDSAQQRMMAAFQSTVAKSQPPVSEAKY